MDLAAIIGAAGCVIAVLSVFGLMRAMWHPDSSYDDDCHHNGRLARLRHAARCGHLSDKSELKKTLSSIEIHLYGLRRDPTETVFLSFLGLFVGGIFVLSRLWLRYGSFRWWFPVVPIMSLLVGLLIKAVCQACHRAWMLGFPQREMRRLLAESQKAKREEHERTVHKALREQEAREAFHQREVRIRKAVERHEAGYRYCPHCRRWVTFSVRKQIRGHHWRDDDYEPYTETEVTLYLCSDCGTECNFDEEP
jgi:hypothetical protein